MTATRLEPVRPWRVMVGVTLCNTLALMPPFLVGAASVFVRADLTFGEAQLGFAVAAYFGASAVFSIPGGRACEQLGQRRSIGIAAITSTATMVGIGLVAGSYLALVVLLIVGGLANGIAQPAANLALSREIPAGRQGLAFGVKQSAILFSTLLSGLALSALVIPFGWRSAFLIIGPVIAVPLLAVYPPIGGTGTAGDRRRGRRAVLRGRGLGLLAVASACVTATAGTLGVFLVESGVDAGLDPAHAGLVLSLGSAVGVLVRLVMGGLADRRFASPLGVVAAMLGAGVFGFLAISIGSSVTFVLGSVVAFGAGWGWAGLFVYAVVRAFPEAPAAATGVTQTGFSAGNVFGPILFGLIVSSWSYTVAWIAAAALAAGGALVMRWGAIVVARSS